VAGDITTQPKQGRHAGPKSSLCILLCLWFFLTLCYETDARNVYVFSVLASLINENSKNVLFPQKALISLLLCFRSIQKKIPLSNTLAYYVKVLNYNSEMKYKLIHTL
jgi:hypothetical protein